MPKGKKKPLREIAPVLAMDFDEAMRRVVRVQPDRLNTKRKKPRK